MHDLSRPVLGWLFALSCGIVLLLAACNGGVRPTVTSDRLVESPATADASEPAIVAATEVPTIDAATADPTDDGTAADATAGAVEQLTVQVLQTFPHDPSAFTQGLELYQGEFLESTGLYGESDLRRVDPETGQVLQQLDLPDEFFAEGLTRVGDQLVQLTWQENTAFYWDLTTFELRQEVGYQGEGWGICHDAANDRLIMTDGTPVLIFRDPLTFEEFSRIDVTLNGEPVYNLNEVECVGDDVWANIWQTELIVRIDPATGAVDGVVDAIALEGPPGEPQSVLNGIAWDETTQSFFVTGKNWPELYRVNFVPEP